MLLCFRCYTLNLCTYGAIDEFDIYTLADVGVDDAPNCTILVACYGKAEAQDVVDGVAFERALSIIYAPLLGTKYILNAVV